MYEYEDEGDYKDEHEDVPAWHGYEAFDEPIEVE